MNSIKLFYISSEGEKYIPIPTIAGRFQLDRVRLAGRLMSTRSRRNYDWQCSIQFSEFLNHSPFEPTFDVLLQDVVVFPLGWHSPALSSEIYFDNEKAKWEYVYEEDYPFWVIWGGTGVDSPALVVARYAEDCTFRKEREELFNILYTEPIYKPHYQGHLEIKYVTKFREEDYFSYWFPEKFNHLLRHPNRPVILFNHATFVQSVVGLDNKRLVQITDVENQGLITSPDHPLEPFQLKDGWWYLEHPFPAKTVD